MHPALRALEHRPWSMPPPAWRWRQQWLDLLFAHWPVPSAAVRALIPEPLEVDEFEEQTYVAVVPFRMAGVMLRPLPDLPGVSAFEELNVRLYVRYQDKPGVWFLSLDANNRLAVWAARTFFALPYHFADMSLTAEGERIRYGSKRRLHGHAFLGSYGPKGPVRLAKPGSLEHWLTERYCLYAKSPKGALYRTEVHHGPWPLQDAEAEFEHSMLEGYGLGVAGPAPLLHFSRFIDVVTWNPELLVPARRDATA